jgi:periplasmic divalent cation tolerance protein
MIASRYCLVLVTAPDVKIARKLSTYILRDRLAACVNLVPKIESHYWWRGKIAKGSEVLMIIKTTGVKLRALEKNVITNHPYDTPEFVVLPITSGNRRYLQWIGDETKK